MSLPPTCVLKDAACNMPPAEPDIALPRASFLSYFNNHTNTNNNNKDNKDSGAGERRPLLPRIAEEDEEGEIGFWGEYGGAEGKGEQQRWRWAVWDVFGVGVYAVVVLIVVLGLDYVVARFGVGGGVGWGDGERGVRQVHFCKGAERGGVRSWGFVPVDRLWECEAEVVTLMATGAEREKLRLGDVVLVGGVFETGSETQVQGGGKFLGEEQGDDQAEEGKLRMGPSNMVHAGFGGSWR
ncbi:hypothetical protein EJ04DRAFT_578424 [Polyplosphaeria fusca]|uniref:Uncharacterized protein n=1 Tax=Polyplosphaeria fusca TaxID=682080 RepID=A0A9P4QWG9_9PLEO|nr:hypothetical protein EJ04DRAFT_578424 [Polyplosphaeria fusca]